MNKNIKTYSYSPIFSTYNFIITILIFICIIITLLIFTKYSKQKFINHAKLTAQTLSYIASSVASETKDEKNHFMFSIAKSALLNDKNILCIEFSDVNGQAFYTEKQSSFDYKNFDGIKVSSPIFLNDKKITKTAGSLKLYFTNKNINLEILKQCCFIIASFILIWLFIIGAYTFSKIILAKELHLLYVGLKYISDGHFGTKINIEDKIQTKELVQIFNDLSVKLKNYEEQNVGSILLEKNKLEAILMSIVNGVVVCDENDTIVLTNLAADKMLAVNSEVIKNIQIQSYADTNGIYCFRDKIEEFKDKPLDEILKNPPEFTITVNKKIIKCIISPMFMQNDDYVGYIIVMLDVTRETEVNNLKNQFISNVSHELRTPVTVLRTYIDTLYTMADSIDEKTKIEFIETANKEVTRLHRMVNDILDVSRLESPDIILEKELADIVPIIEETITSMQILANEKNVNIIFSKDANETILPINTVNIERVLNNLLSNAIKYSPENGKINVCMKKSGNYLDISVRDEGPGIAEEHIPKLFDRFYRVENSVHTVKGTGLGLYLVKTSVEKQYGGQVYVKSKINQGSTFGIKLPIS